MKDVIIENNQLKIISGSFVFTKTEIEYSIRAVSEILQTVTGEDPQDVLKGLDLQGVMFNNNSNSSDLYAEILRNILAVDGVQSVENIEVTQEEENLKITAKYIYNGEQVEVGVIAND